MRSITWLCSDQSRKNNWQQLYAWRMWTWESGRNKTSRRRL